MGFCYAPGQGLGGLPTVTATKAETNMKVSNMLVDESLAMRAFAVRIPMTAPASIQQYPTSYPVTADDIREFCDHAVVRFYLGGEVPWVEFTPKATRAWIPSRGKNVETGVVFGQFTERMWPLPDERMQSVLVRGQEKPFALERGLVLPMPLVIGRIEKFWADVEWIGGPPTFGSHPDDKSVRGRLALEFWIIGDVATREDEMAAMERVKKLLAQEEEGNERLRRFYDEHPASAIAPCACPPLSEWTVDKQERRVHGELTLEARFDPCRTWSATLCRMAPVGTMPSSDGRLGVQVQALFFVNVNGVATRDLAERAAITAAHVAGWVKDA